MLKLAKISKKLLQMCLKKLKKLCPKIKQKYDDSDSINRKSKKKNTSHKKNQRPVLKQKIQ